MELNEQKMDQKMFDSLKKGDKLSVSFGSGIRKDNKVTLLVKSKSKSAKYNLEKINCVNVNNPGGMKYTIYNRQGKFSLAQGDMATSGPDFVKESVELEEKRDAGKSATGYDIYHKTYSGAMQHAYAHAKKKHGVTVSSDDIDSKVASGIQRKPSTGKTVSHILGTDKKKNLHVQVYNTGKSYELNMYVESVELDEAIDFFKVSKELLDYAKKNGGPDKREFEKAAAYVREIGKNSAVSVQDKAGKGLNMLFKNVDTDVRDRMQMILTKGGFKVKGGSVMREGKWFVRQSAKPNKTGTYQGKKFDDGKKAIAQARKDWKLTPDEHMSAKMMKEGDEMIEEGLNPNWEHLGYVTSALKSFSEGLNPKQIALLKKNYASIDRVDPNGPAYKKAKGMISGLPKDMQMDLAKAKVKFLSQIAADELRKQHGVKLKAKDYMEAVDLEEKGKGLWHNIRKKRARGEKPAKPGEKGYPKTLDIDEEMTFEKIREKYKTPTQKEIDADRRKDQRGKSRPSATHKSIGSKLYKNLRNEDDDPCWDSHKQVGMKKGKGGKPVPNCVPK